MWWFVVLLVTCVLYYSSRRLSYFSSRGVRTLPPVPLLGNLTAVTFGKENFVEAIAAGYDAFKDQRYFGLYQYLVPTVVPRDPNLIREIMVRDFNVFCDRGIHIGPDCDPLFGRNLVVLRGSKWREMRTALTPAFSSARFRSMATLMAENASNAATYLKEKITKPELMDFNVVTLAYVNDVISSCAFGFAVDSLQEPDNCLLKLGKKAMINETTQVMKLFGYANMGSVMKFLKVKLIATKDANQFSELFTSALKARRENLVPTRPDFIQILVDAAQGKAKPEENDSAEHTKASEKFADDELVAQAVLFYIAGFDTTANLINFFLYEMAANPHIQDKLYEELSDLPPDEEIENIYDVVQRLEYLDMCVSEVLRMWPLVGSFDRVSQAPYDFGPTSEGSKDRLIVPAGVHVWIPIYSIHRDEKYWPNPNVFDPERFSPERKSEILPYTYLPFGTGPRHCIGSRFALLVTKVFLIKFLRLFKTKTDHKLSRLSPRAFILRPAEGFNLVIEPRNNNE